MKIIQYYSILFIRVLNRIYCQGTEVSFRDDLLMPDKAEMSEQIHGRIARLLATAERVQIGERNDPKSRLAIFFFFFQIWQQFSAIGISGK